MSLGIIELFAGVGSQSAALERLGVDCENVGISEIDKDAMASYSAIHCGLLEKLNSHVFPTKKEMAQYLTDRNIGFNFKNNKPFDWFKGIETDKETATIKDLKKYYLACILSKNYGDISKIEKLPNADFWTYSFPCQDISVAGLQRGIEKGKTRSGLLYEVERLLEKSKECNELPKYLMLENVKNLVGKQFKAQFDEWLKRLDELGYNTYWKVLNAKNYGIPQSRERVFAISIRKDIDMGYIFPEPFDNGKRLKDILESEVDEKYYLSNEKVKLFSKQGNVNPSGKGINGNVCTNDICNTLTTNKGEGSKVLIPQATKQGYIECNVPGVADLSFPDSKTRRGRVQENGEICPTLMGGVQNICFIDEPQVLSPKRTEYGKAIRKDYESGLISESRHNMTEMKPREDGICNTLTTVQKDNYVVEPNTEDTQIVINPLKGISNNGWHFEQQVYDSSGITRTVKAGGGSGNIPKVIEDFRIRKLTPLETWRLMGFTDEQFRKAEQVNSNSQLYKQAGNSICVDVLYYLFNKLFVDVSVINKPIEDDQIFGQTNIYDFLEKDCVNKR